MPNRVRVSDYASLDGESELLEPIPSAGSAGQRLHWRAAAGFVALAGGVRGSLGLELRAASGWRPHRWSSRRDYEETLVRRYGSIAEGRRWLAFNSPHETGLAVDLGAGGLWPDRRSVERQHLTPLHRWLAEHAASYGWYPYSVEPWHWEYPIEPSIFWAPRIDAQAAASAPIVATASTCDPDEDDWICEAEVSGGDDADGKRGADAVQ